MKKESEYEVRPVVGYEGLYSVSNTGEVFSHNYQQTGQTKQLKLQKTIKGYLIVALCQDGKQNRHSVHRLVLQAFVPNPENKQFCDHIDTNKANNHVSNLRWVTAKENSNNPITRKNNSNAKKGKNNNRYDTTIYTFKNKSGDVFTGERYEFIKKYDLSKSGICGLVKGRLSQHKGWVLV